MRRTTSPSHASLSSYEATFAHSALRDLRTVGLLDPQDGDRMLVAEARAEALRVLEGKEKGAWMLRALLALEGAGLLRAERAAQDLNTQDAVRTAVMVLEDFVPHRVRPIFCQGCDLPSLVHLCESCGEDEAESLANIVAAEFRSMGFDVISFEKARGA